MSDAEFTVRFRGEAPDGLKVGDVVQISGTVTVHAIIGDLIDISTLDEKRYAVGDTRIDLYSNQLEVKR